MMRHRSNSVKAFSDEVAGEGVDTLFLVWLTSRAATDLVDGRPGAGGLTGDEFAVYSMLAAERTVTPTDLARWMAAPATTVSSYVKRFEARGHVVREPNPDDRRSYRIKLTPAGRRAHRAAAARFRPLNDLVTEALGPREARVRESLLALRVALDQARSSPPA